MPDHPQGRAPARGQIDFDAYYQGRPPVEGVEIAFDVPPWDIGEPQPALVALEKSGALRSDILDAGCGGGDNALFLAERGYRVTGFDAAPTAIAQARQRAQARGVDLQLVLADATRLEGLEPRFNTVLDSGLYHCLSDQQYTDYAAALHRVTQPGAHLHLFCFSGADSPVLRPFEPIGQDHLRTHLGAHWDIRSIESTRYTTSFTRQFFEWHRNTFEMIGRNVDIDQLRTDTRGRVTPPFLQLHAVRK